MNSYGKAGAVDKKSGAATFMTIPPLAHIGLPKTASTYLQKHYFSLHSIYFFSTQAPFEWPRELNFVFDANYFWYSDLEQNYDALSLQDRAARYWALTKTHIGKWSVSASRFALNAEEYGSWLISAEGLCGLSGEVNKVQLKLLKQAGVKKIFFVCRQQARWAESLWKQFLLAEDRFGRYVPFETLFGEGMLDSGVIESDWMQYIKALDSEFGSDNVLVLPYELLLSDSTDFFRRLNRFLGLEENSFIPDVGVRENVTIKDSTYVGLVLDEVTPFLYMPRIRRWLHRIARRRPWLMPRAIKKEMEVRVSEHVLKEIMSYHGVSNVHLEARIGINLHAYEYY